MRLGQFPQVIDNTSYHGYYAITWGNLQKPITSHRFCASVSNLNTLSRFGEILPFGKGVYFYV